MSGDDFSFDGSLVGPDDLIELELTQTGERKDPETPALSETAEIKILLGDLFVQLYELLLGDPLEENLQSPVGKAAWRIIHPGQKRPENLSCFVSRADVVKIRQQFEALGLVKLTTREVGSFIKSSAFCWNITSKGRRYATLRLAQRKPSEAS